MHIGEHPHVYFAVGILLSSYLALMVECNRLTKTNRRPGRQHAKVGETPDAQQAKIVFGEIFETGSNKLKVVDGMTKISSNVSVEDKTAYQADSAGLPDASLGRAWNNMGHSLSCGEDQMKFRAVGPEALHFALDQGNAHPLPLSQVPKVCGYHMHRNALILVLMVPYGGCHMLQQDGSYVLPMRWHEYPVSLWCPKHGAHHSAPQKPMYSTYPKVPNLPPLPHPPHLSYLPPPPHHHLQLPYYPHPPQQPHQHHHLQLPYYLHPPQQPHQHHHLPTLPHRHHQHHHLPTLPQPHVPPQLHAPCVPSHDSDKSPCPPISYPRSSPPYYFTQYPPYLHYPSVTGLRQSPVKNPKFPTGERYQPSSHGLFQPYFSPHSFQPRMPDQLLTTAKPTESTTTPKAATEEFVQPEFWEASQFKHGPYFPYWPDFYPFEQVPASKADDSYD